MDALYNKTLEILHGKCSRNDVKQKVETLNNEALQTMYNKMVATWGTVRDEAVETVYSNGTYFWDKCDPSKMRNFIGIVGEMLKTVLWTDVLCCSFCYQINTKIAIFCAPFRFLRSSFRADGLSKVSL